MKQQLARSGFAVLLGLSVIVPFLNYHRVSPSPTFYSELAAAFFFLAASVAGASLLPKRQPVDASFALFSFGLLALLAFQVLSGTYYEFMMSWASWAGFLCLFFLATTLGQLAASESDLRRLIVDRLVAALLLAALFNAFAQIAQVTEWSQSIRPIVFIPSQEKYGSYICTPAGNVAQLNHANAVAWLGIAGLVHALNRRQVRPVLALAGFAVLLLSSALTSSRMAWLMAAAVAVALPIAYKGMGLSVRRALTVGAALMTGLFVATLLRQQLLSGCQSSIERAVSGFGGGAAQGHDYWVRLEMVRQSLMVWWSQPIAGVGVGKFMAKTFALEPSRDMVEPLDFYPHNSVLEILLSFGLLGGILLLVCSGIWIVRIWRNRNDTSEQWFLIAALAILCVPALLELALWNLYFLLPFALMLGIASGVSGGSTPSISLPWRRLVPAIALVGAPALAFSALDHLRAERVMWLSALARTPGVFAGPAAQAIPDGVRQLKLFAVWGEHEALRFGEESPNDLDAQLAANRRLLDNIPNPHIVARQVMLETLAGHPDRARDLFRRMMVFFPNHYGVLAEELRRRASTKPEHAGVLLRIIEEETARPPRSRGAVP